MNCINFAILFFFTYLSFLALSSFLSCHFLVCFYMLFLYRSFVDMKTNLFIEIAYFSMMDPSQNVMVM